MVVSFPQAPTFDVQSDLLYCVVALAVNQASPWWCYFVPRRHAPAQIGTIPVLEVAGWSHLETS
jgi:hypothetical protein